jgi:hypothetical protein
MWIKWLILLFIIKKTTGVNVDSLAPYFEGGNKSKYIKKLK